MEYTTAQFISHFCSNFANLANSTVKRYSKNLQREVKYWQKYLVLKYAKWINLLRFDFYRIFFFYFSHQIPPFEMSAYLKFKSIAACLNKTFSNKISNGHFVADMKFMGIIVNMTILLKRNMVKNQKSITLKYPFFFKISYFFYCVHVWIKTKT